jgi:hypothetical protein
MTYRYKKTGFASALALGVAMMGLAGAASASSIHVLTSDGQVLLAKTATGTTKLVNTIRPLAGTEDPNNPNFSPNSLGFFDGTFYATSFMNDGDEIIYSFDAGTGLGNFNVNTFAPASNGFAAGDANADGFTVVQRNGDRVDFDLNGGGGTVGGNLTGDSSTFGDIAFDTFNPGVIFASYNNVLEKFVDGASVGLKSFFNRYVGLGFDEFGQLFGVGASGGIFALDFDNPAQTRTSTIAGFNLDGGPRLTDAASVTPVPLPAAGWLLLVGFGGLAALRRRKRAA